MNKFSKISFALSALATGLALAPGAMASAYDQMIVFGDSLSDNGNLSTAVGSSFLTALDYDPLRITDGPTTTPSSSLAGVTVEQLNGMLGLPTLVPALLGGGNYAWALATTDASGFDLTTLTTPGTGTQVGAYLATHPAASANSLYVLWAGSNDLLNATTPAGIIAAESAAISNLTLQAFALLSSGARNIAWFDLPDLSLTPGGFLEGAVLAAQLHQSSLQFRADWSASIAALEALFPTANITGIDTFTEFNTILANPLAYGISNVSVPALGQVAVNPDQSLFWDTIHPTTKADSILADYAYHQLSSVPEPSGSVYLAFALFALVAYRLYKSRRPNPQAILADASAM